MIMIQLQVVLTVDTTPEQWHTDPRYAQWLLDEFQRYVKVSHPDILAVDVSVGDDWEPVQAEVD